MNSIKLRTERLGELTLVKILIRHPMENGRNRDPINGALLPAHHISLLQIRHNGQLKINCRMGGSIAKNPLFSFHLPNLKSGDSLLVSWEDNLMNTDNLDYRITEAD